MSKETLASKMPGGGNQATAEGASAQTAPAQPGNGTAGLSLGVPAGPSAEQAVGADRERAFAILSCDEAKGREELAQRLALKTSMSVEEAKALLASAPQAQTASRLDGLMEQAPNPNVQSEEVAAAKPRARPNATEIYARRRQEMTAAT